MALQAVTWVEGLLVVNLDHFHSAGDVVNVHHTDGSGAAFYDFYNFLIARNENDRSRHFPARIVQNRSSFVERAAQDFLDDEFHSRRIRVAQNDCYVSVRGPRMGLASENLAKISQSRRSNGIRGMDDDGKIGRERGSRDAGEQQPESQ